MTYLMQSKNLHRAIALIDSSVGFTDSDKFLIEMLTDINQTFMVVLTKADKLKN